MKREEMKRACEIIDDYGDIYQMASNCEAGGFGPLNWYSTWVKYVNTGELAVYYHTAREELQRIYQNDKTYSDLKTWEIYKHVMAMVLSRLYETLHYSYDYEKLPKAVKTAARFLFWNEARGDEPQAMADMITHREAAEIWKEYHFTIEKLHNETGITFTACELLEK